MIHTIENQNALLANAKQIEIISGQIKEGDILVAKRVFSPDLIVNIKSYLSGIGRNSLPNYRPIEAGCPNHHRINHWDERSYVKACFHQFSFFPWNQDIFNLFELSRQVYHMKNLLSGNRKDRFLGRAPEDGCAARLSFQFYPKGLGAMNKHQDPVDHHQLAAPSLTMSKKGKDFRLGGAYVEKKNGEKIYTDEISEPGDVVYYNAQIPHGVEKIDPDAEPDWVSFEGRWVLLFAVNKLGGSSAIADAVDLENSSPRP